MFKFFRDPKWFLWAYIGSAIILSSLWVQVQIDVKINEWFGEFYDMIQEELSAPYAITIEEYWASLLSFIILAAIYVGVAVVVSFFTSPANVSITVGSSSLFLSFCKSFKYFSSIKI